MDDFYNEIVTPSKKFITLLGVVHNLGHNFDPHVIVDDLIKRKRNEFPSTRAWESWKASTRSRAKIVSQAVDREEEENMRVIEAWISRNPQKAIDAVDFEKFWFLWEEWEDYYCREFWDDWEEWSCIASDAKRELPALISSWQAWEGERDNNFSSFAKECCINHERKRRAATRLIQAFQCVGSPKWFISEEGGGTVEEIIDSIRLASDQAATERAVEGYLTCAAKPGKPEDLGIWGDSTSCEKLEREVSDVYLEIKELIAVLDRQAIPHAYRATAPDIPILCGDAEDPNTNLIFKKPARLRGCPEGPSLVKAIRYRQIRNKEGEETTLTPYLKLPQWTPAMAAMLTCGLRSRVGEDKIPSEAIGLWYRGSTKVNLENCIFFAQAEELLGQWNLQKPSNSNVAPKDWITWCGELGIRCYWLRDIPLAGKWIKHLDDAGIVHPFELPDEQGPKRAPPVNNTENKGGRPAGLLRQALNHFCQRLIEGGEGELLEPGTLNKFMLRLRKAIQDGKHHDAFIAERIEAVNQRGPIWHITLNDWKGEPQKPKTSAYVSKFLSERRR